MIDDWISWDFYNGDNSLYDERLYDYHVTYICTNIAQIAPDVSVLPVKFMSGTKGTIEDAISAIEYAIERGAIDEEGCMYASSGYGKKVDIEVIVPENAITKVSGTSIATSYVSAAAALMLSLDEKLTPNEIKKYTKRNCNTDVDIKGKV